MGLGTLRFQPYDDLVRENRSLRAIWLIVTGAAAAAYAALMLRAPDRASYFAVPLAVLAAVSAAMYARSAVARWLLVIPVAAVVGGSALIGLYGASDILERTMCPDRPADSEPCPDPRFRRAHAAIMAGSVPVAAMAAAGAGAAIAPASRVEVALALGASGSILVGVLSVGDPLAEAARALAGGLAGSFLVSVWTRRESRKPKRRRPLHR